MQIVVRVRGRLTPLWLFLVAGFIATAVLAQSKSASTSDTVACRVMEAKASERLDVRWVIFHYRDTPDRDRLGRLLREYDGATVEFQARPQGQWQAATVWRLKSCFGRGLLVFPASGPSLAEGNEFWLRFHRVPASSATH